MTGELLISNECKNRRLGHDEVSIALERYLDCRLAKKERVIAGARLHRNELRRPLRHPPRLVAEGIGARHRKTRTGRDAGPTLHGLVLERCRRQVQSDVRPLLALFATDEHAIADDDELLVSLDHQRS